MTGDQDTRLHQLLADLSARVASLESAVARLEATNTARPPEAKPLTPASPPDVIENRVSPPKPQFSLETRIGEQWLNRAGILAVLTGVAWFLKLAFDRNWIGPSIRVWIGLVTAVGLVLWSERFRKRGYPAFAYSLKALGTSIAYLSLWAAASLFHLAPPMLIFVAMIAVTVFNALLAHRR